MSKVTDVYNGILERLKDLFELKTRIPYAYNIESNNQRFLIDGYALKFGAASFEEIDTCGFNIARDVSVIFTRSLYKLDSDYEAIDELLIEMLEDVYTVQKDFYNYNELGIADKIARVRISGIGEPEEVESGSTRFISIEASFIFDINERL